MASRIASAALLIASAAASAAVAATVPAFWAAVSICWTIPSRSFRAVRNLAQSSAILFFTLGSGRSRLLVLSSIAIISLPYNNGGPGGRVPPGGSGRQPGAWAAPQHPRFPFPSNQRHQAQVIDFGPGFGRPGQGQPDLDGVDFAYGLLVAVFDNAVALLFCGRGGQGCP